MEILRFDDAGSTSARRKKSSRGMIVVGLIATLFGVGTAFASTTISINGGAATNIGQGVSTVSACDDDIKISVNNSLTLDSDGKTRGKPTFTSSGVVLSKINSNAFDTSTATGCGGEIIDFQIYRQVSKGSDLNQAYTCGQLGITSDTYLKSGSGTSTSTKFTCSAESRTVSFVVPTTNQIESSWIVPLDPATGLSPLDISYFTVVSRSAA